MSLYEAVIPRYKQSLAVFPGILDKTIDFCETKKVDPDVLLDARLYPDMHPLRWQLGVMLFHSETALASAKSGTFVGGTMRKDLASLQDFKAALQAIAAQLQSEDKAKFDALADKDVTMVFGDMKVPMTARGFLTSFSLPNFYFHASMAYAILRHNGVAVGKQDFLGPIETKQ